MSGAREPVGNTNNDVHNAPIADEYLAVSCSLIISHQGSEDTISFRNSLDLLDLSRLHEHRRLSLFDDRLA